ncbi:hypothetical protein P5G65_21180 [Paenibacillus chondroitinus]|uniref:Uncharacterized protein n=1 Tax=Paenibacillus chondroitinus TaxID=59842 RepID=A0ABU6DF92_9BACL|nr:MULTISPECIES: hypothetical protein [Paenibacillus]MCY9659243.1 hypothetical protein [Paenibacillus anseongense]MEB4796422.1 hypothetical protein [Paenibacillus chondroitinus]
MTGMRSQAPMRSVQKKDSESGERAVPKVERSATTGHWMQLQRTLGNRRVGELLQRNMQLSAEPTEIVVQRAPGLPTKQDLESDGLKAGTKFGLGKTSWGNLGDALVVYEKLGNTDYAAQKEQLTKIEHILGEWRASYNLRESNKKLKKKDPAKLLKVNEILESIKQRRAVILEAEAPSDGRDGRRRAEAFSKREVIAPLTRQQEIVEEKKEMKASETMDEYLKKSGYKQDRNYMSWGNGTIAHVSWKAHVGSGDASQRLDIAQMVSPLLKSWEVYHKFDITPTPKPIDKFLTVYPPDADEEWENIVNMLESALGGFATVDVTGDMPVGETGKVNMRHGQNTPLTPSMLRGVDVASDGKVGDFTKMVGTAVQGDGLPLWELGGKLFFNKIETAEPPSKLNPNTIYMAILVDGRIVPDKREEPNPANVPLPKGVKKFERL